MDRDRLTVSRRRLLRGAVGVTGLIAAGPLLEACGPAAQAPSPSVGSASKPGASAPPATLTIALPGVMVESLNPYSHSTAHVYPTWKHVLEPLVDWDGQRKEVVGVLAESWTNPDDHTWLFKLKQGVRFHDGRNFTSADVVYSFRDRIQNDPHSKLRSAL